jgi:hypothetical protein
MVGVGRLGRDGTGSYCHFVEPAVPLRAVFCRPATGHDKGGVEARGKGIRLQHLVPIPAGESLDTISRVLLARLDAQAADRLAVTVELPRSRGAMLTSMRSSWSCRGGSARGRLTTVRTRYEGNSVDRRHG